MRKKKTPGRSRSRTSRKSRKRRNAAGGNRCPKELIRERIVHDLPEGEAEEQGLEKWEGHFEESVLINVVPTKIVREVHKRQKYRPTKARNPDLCAIVTAQFTGEPRKIHAGDLYSLEFDIEVALAKYLWHLPLDRQVRMMASNGLSIDSQTLYSRIDTLAFYLEAGVDCALSDEPLNRLSADLAVEEKPPLKAMAFRMANTAPVRRTAQGFRVQLGAFAKGSAAASAAWQALIARYPELREREPVIAAARTADGHAIHRLQVGGYDRAGATALCQKLAADHNPCLVVAPAPAAARGQPRSG